VGKPVMGSFLALPSEEQVIQAQRAFGLEPSKIKLPEQSMVFCIVESLEPESYFSFRWIPYGIDAECDPECEEKTLVEFWLEESVHGTRLRVTETGFDKIPENRRKRAFLMNEGGWQTQLENIKHYLDHESSQP
jgi:uncharacterized protein YndB with AHSA1/START domain